MDLSKALEEFKAQGGIPESSIPEKIGEISMYNPTREQILQTLERFEEAGVDTPVLYPYVATKDDAFKLKTVEMLSKLAR